MSQYTQEELAEILKRHKRWLDESEGWSEEDKANLRGADLRGADLRGADLRGADLYGADLRGADLRVADLYGADLRGADLYGADLRGAKGSAWILAQTEIVPSEGSFIGWKKCRDGAIVKLRIPEGAQRSNATGRKCRASFADVLEIRDKDGNRTDVAYSFFDTRFEYRAGSRVVADYWDPDRLDECSGGIHFFLTREEAKEFVW